MHDLFHPCTNLAAMIHTMLAFRNTWLSLHDSYRNIYPFTVSGTQIFNAGFALAEQLASALLALKNSNPNDTTKHVIQKVNVNRKVLQAAVSKVQEQTAFYLKTNSNAELRKSVEEQQKAARTLVAEMVGYIVGLTYVGANAGLRVLGLSQIPANATPITEWDAPVIARAVKDNATITSNAKSFSAPTAQGQARMLTEASDAAYEAFTKPMVTQSGASTRVITAKPTFGTVIAQADAPLQPGAQTEITEAARDT